MSSNIVAITLENFQQIVLEASKNKLILVDFWAEQVPESIELRDTLAARIVNFSDYMILATVDCQTQHQIAQQFGIQGLPTAILVKDGQPIDGISGPQTEQKIAEFLERNLPKEEDTLLVQAKKALQDGHINIAFTDIYQAHKCAPERADIKLVLADVYLHLGNIEEAQQLIEQIKMVDQDSYYHAILAKLELANQAADSPEIQILEQQLSEDSDNVELQQKLAVQYSQAQRHEDALTMLFRLVQKDGSDTISKQLLLDVLKLRPDGDPLATKFRRKLYTLLY